MLSTHIKRFTVSIEANYSNELERALERVD
jgi:hypothetical protein